MSLPGRTSRLAATEGIEPQQSAFELRMNPLIPDHRKRRNRINEKKQNRTFGRAESPFRQTAPAGCSAKTSGD
jgi:hypothetical protein